MPEPVDGYLPGHGDRRRMEELRHSGADECDAQEHAGGVVYDYAATPGVSIGKEVGTGDGGRTRVPDGHRLNAAALRVPARQ